MIFPACMRLAVTFGGMGWRLAWVLLWGGLFAGCLPGEREYTLGFGSTVIVGNIELDKELPAHDAIVVVFIHRDTFIPLAEGEGFSPVDYPQFRGNITHPGIQVLSVSPAGAFRVTLPVEATTVEILCIVPDRLTHHARFRRSVGVRRIAYRPRLPSAADWRSHFYTSLEPQLAQFIVEPRYQLSQREQRLLGDWLVMQKNRLEFLSPLKKRSKKEGP